MLSNKDPAESKVNYFKKKKKKPLILESRGTIFSFIISLLYIVTDHRSFRSSLEEESTSPMPTLVLQYLGRAFLHPSDHEQVELQKA